VGLVILAGPTPAQSRPARRTAAPPPGWTAFTAAFDGFARSDRVVGGTVAVLRDGRILARHDYGLGDRAAATPVDPAAVYHWASITKTLTAIAIMQLRDRGRLTLDDPVTRWLPELRQVHDSFGAVDDITIRMLLSHSAGFQNPTWPYGEGKPWEPFEPTRWEQLVAMMPYQEIGFAPGSRWGYSNPAFIYLGRIIEALTGDPYEVYIQKNIWTPLGMTRSFFGVSPYHLSARRAASYTVRADSAAGERIIEHRREFDPGITIPNGGWNAPIEDFAIYLAFLSGATHGDSAAARRQNAVLPRASLEEMWRPVVPMPAGPASGESFGLSFYLFRRDRTTVVGHTGEQSGFRSFFYLDPATSTAVVGVVNTTNEAEADRSLARWEALTHRAVELVAP
jgi:CubicO group peptidase (beta-lactamase class C family)